MVLQNLSVQALVSTPDGTQNDHRRRRDHTGLRHADVPDQTATWRVSFGISFPLAACLSRF
jgi:hypothetical protein